MHLRYPLLETVYQSRPLAHSSHHLESHAVPSWSSPMSISAYSISLCILKKHQFPFTIYLPMQYIWLMYFGIIICCACMLHISDHNNQLPSMVASEFDLRKQILDILEMVMLIWKYWVNAPPALRPVPFIRSAYWLIDSRLLNNQPIIECYWYPYWDISMNHNPMQHRSDAWCCTSDSDHLLCRLNATFLGA